MIHNYCLQVNVTVARNTAMFVCERTCLLKGMQRRVNLIRTQRCNFSTTKDNALNSKQKSLNRIHERHQNELVKTPQLILPSLTGLDEWRADREHFQQDIKHDESNGGLTLPLSDMYQPELHLPSAPTDWKGFETSTPLTDEVIALIGVTGRPITVAEYMRMALQHPEYGYYTNATSKLAEDGFDDDADDDAGSWSSNDDTIIGADFVTAPEVSNLFGESLGVWFVANHVKKENGSHNDSIKFDTPESSRKRLGKWQWLECGPGNGTLTVDFLRFCRNLASGDDQDLSAFGNGCSHIHLIETSPAMRKKQQDELYKNFKHQILFRFDDDASGNQEAGLSTAKVISGGANAKQRKKDVGVTWHNSIADFRIWQQKYKALPTMIVAQEFLDALPVYTFEKCEEGYWRERLVDVAMNEDAGKDPQSEQNGQSSDQKPRLRIVLAPEATPALKTLLQTDKEGYLAGDDSAPSGSVVEISPESILFCQDVAAVIQQQGGSALVIDYGSTNGSRDSLRGFSRHQQVHFLSRPGEVDVTADVDFNALKHCLNSENKQRAFGPIEQGQFLVSMGITSRVISLIERDDVSEEKAENLYKALERLASPDEMGSLYKVLAITDSSNGAPPGF